MTRAGLSGFLAAIALLACIDVAPAADQALRVGVSNTPPFAIRHADGSWSGIAVDLWRDVATGMGRSWTLQELPLAEQLEGIRNGALDVVLGPIAITPENGEVAAFTHSYLAPTVAVAVRPQNEGWSRIFTVLLAPRLVHVLVSMAVVVLVLGGLVWLLERRRNPGHFEERAVRGLWSAVWWATTTITTVGYGDKTPRTVLGQIVAIVGMVGGLLLVSVLTATFASEITLLHLDSDIRHADDLRRVVVGTVAGSAGEDWLAEHGIAAHIYPEIRNAFVALDHEDIDALVYLDVVLRYWVSTTVERKPRVLPIAIESAFLGFATPIGSPVLPPMNAALLRAIHGDAWKRVLTSYIGAP